MKKLLLIIVAVIVLGALWFVGQYNGLVSGRGAVDMAWANVETQYQRRSDLVPQLVATVQGAADFEKNTLTQVIEARAAATSVKVDTSNAESLAQFTQTQGQLGSALSRLLVSVEAYPTLQANQNFRDLQSQLEGTENRIAVARGDYNTTAGAWNIRIARFPAVLFARIFGFDPSALFDAAPGSENAPKIEFKF